MLSHVLSLNARACDTIEQLAINSANLDGATPFHRGRGGMVSVNDFLQLPRLAQRCCCLDNLVAVCAEITSFYCLDDSSFLHRTAQSPGPRQITSSFCLKMLATNRPLASMVRRTASTHKTFRVRRNRRSGRYPSRAAAGATTRTRATRAARLGLEPQPCGRRVRAAAA